MIERSKVAAKNLMKTIQPILLQRKKCEHKETLKLKEKVELVVWIPLSSTQRKVYEKYLLKRTVKDALDRKNFAVDVINDLKTISRHPFLMEASESLKGSNIIKKADQGRDQGRVSQEDRFDLSHISDALQSLSVSKQVKSSSNSNDNSSSSSHVIRKRVSEYDDDDDKDNSDEDEDEGGRGYNIGRSNDSRFTGSASNSSTMHRNQHSNSSRPNNSNNNNNKNNDKFIDQNQAMYDDDDEEGVLDRTVGGRKIKANANVFEIVGREPETEELLQVD